MYSKLRLITIGSNIEEVPLINLSANVFVFRDFWLTYSGGTDRTGERCFTISISNDFTQMNNPPARIHDYNSHSSSSTGFFPSDPSIRSTVAFPSLENSDHVVVLFSIDFPSNSKGDASFYHKPHDYSHDWDDIHDHLRDVPWENVFKLGTFLLLLNFVGESMSKLMYVSLIVNIRLRLSHLHGFQLLLLLP